MKRTIAMLLVVLAVIASVPSLVFAASPWTEKGTYSEKAVAKLDFGMKNTLGGWTEIFTEPKRCYDEKKCIAQGVGRGIVNAVVYTAGGLVHVATFPIVQLDIPLPNNGVNL